MKPIQMLKEYNTILICNVSNKAVTLLESLAILSVGSAALGEDL
jgi:hypothetical protein